MKRPIPTSIVPAGRAGSCPDWRDEKRVWSHTEYDFPKLIAACEKIAREAVAKAGGRVEKDAESREVLVIPVEEPRPSALEECHAPGPVAGAKFTDQELARIRPDR